MYNNSKEKELKSTFEKIQSLLTVEKNKSRFFPKENVFQLIEEQVGKLKEITNNPCIGHDSMGKELHLGDKCSFLVDVSNWGIHANGLNLINEKKAILEGVITYDESYYGYCLDTENEYMPSILMSCIDFGEITKIDEFTKAPVTSKSENNDSLEEDLQY